MTSDGMVHDQSRKFDAGKESYVDRYTVTEMQQMLWAAGKEQGSSSSDLLAIANAFPEFALMSTNLYAVGDVLAFGANKYAAFSWSQVTPCTRYVDAFMRHALAADEYDPESQMSHRWHMQCNQLFLAKFQAAGRLIVINDRFEDWEDSI